MPRRYGETGAQQFAVAPPVGTAGATYYNTTSKTLFISDGTAWGAVGGGESEVKIDPAEPTPVAGLPELWVDTDETLTDAGWLTSGTWGTAPLTGAVFGTDLNGREIYLDSQGKLRSRPELISGSAVNHPVTALSPTYPTGTSVMYVSNTDGVSWPSGTGCVVVTSKVANDAAMQWCAANTTGTKVWIRYGNSTAWQPWTYVGEPQELPGSVDLNTITASGTYTQSQSADAISGTNYPVPVAGLLEVVSSPVVGAGSMAWQRYTVYATHATYGGKVFTRGMYNGTWDPWLQVASPRTPRVARWKSTSQTLTTASTYYTLTYESEDEPGVGITYSGGVFTFTESGVYQVNALQHFSPITANPQLRLTFLVNGTVYGFQVSGGVSSSLSQSLGLNKSWRFAAGDTLAIQAFSTNASQVAYGGASRYSYIDITKIA